MTAADGVVLSGGALVLIHVIVLCSSSCAVSDRRGGQTVPGAPLYAPGGSRDSSAAWTASR